MKTFDFGVALKSLKDGDRVARKGWNGKGMWLVLIHGDNLTNTINDNYGDPNHPGLALPVLDAIYMKTADNKLVPWLASQTDLLAEDWTNS